MITSLRKRHRYTWLILSVLLVLGFGAAFWLVQGKAYEDYSSADLAEAYPDIIKSTDQENIKLNLRKDAQENLQVEVYIKKSVPLPAPVLYLNLSGEASIQDNQVLGGVGAVGLYRFPIETKDVKGIFFYSPLNGKIVYQTQLN